MVVSSALRMIVAVMAMLVMAVRHGGGNVADGAGKDGDGVKFTNRGMSDSADSS